MIELTGSSVAAPAIPETVASTRQRLIDVHLARAEAEAQFDAACLAHFGRRLHEHERLRQRVLGLLLEPDGLAWSWGLVCQHCGLSAEFLEPVLEALLGRAPPGPQAPLPYDATRFRLGAVCKLGHVYPHATLDGQPASLREFVYGACVVCLEGKKARTATEEPSAVTVDDDAP
jgi:hypothetical protein